MVANWSRVGYCQGNFNSDNCAAGGFTLDYGPFGFCDEFDPNFQPWTGGGDHFAFFNQPLAAEKNFQMFCKSIEPLLSNQLESLGKLNQIKRDFGKTMATKMQSMWASKLGLGNYDDALVKELISLMYHTQVDYTIFFRELSKLPNNLEAIKRSFYQTNLSDQLVSHWQNWLNIWQTSLRSADNFKSMQADSVSELSKQMKKINPKYTLREWFLLPAYQQAAKQDYHAVRELQNVMTQPYETLSDDVEKKYYRLKPKELFDIGGLSQYSCSS